MIVIRKSQTADTRSCDYANVSEQTLFDSTVSHVQDVTRAIHFFRLLLEQASLTHDDHKFETMDRFHKAFVDGFKDTSWWDEHARETRHYLLKHVPEDVNLVDVIEFICDCVMAGMARTGKVYDIELPNEVLQKAFQNSINLLKNNVTVLED